MEKKYPSHPEQLWRPRRSTIYMNAPATMLRRSPVVFHLTPVTSLNLIVSKYISSMIPMQALYDWFMFEKLLAGRLKGLAKTS